jgi:mutator protein MutT
MAIRVAAAVIERGARVLVTRRLEGTHLAGLWEFPGGKCEPGESIEACLVRELREELGVDVTPGEILLVTTHAYPEKTVELHFIACDMPGEPSAQQGQEMRWVERAALDTLEFPAADAELISQLRRR